MVVEGCPMLYDVVKDTESQDRFKWVLETLDIQFTLNPRLVRGLDYYNHTCFEFKVDSPHLGKSQNTVLAGGRYDGLSRTLGSTQSIPAVGWAAGLNRLEMIMDEEV